MTEANFAACCAFVRKQEGGNTDTPGDRGGRTGRGGITHTTYDAYRARKGFAPRDVFKITDPEIAEIYAQEYWAPIYGDRLPAGQDLALFDYAINSGPGKANETRLAAGNADTVTLIHKICTARLSFLHSIQTWSRFGPGWARRVAECEVLALQMANGLTPGAANNAEQNKLAKRRRIPQILTGTAGAVTGAEHFAASHWVIAAILAFSAIGVAVAMFNARQQGVRSDVLADAIQRMQTAQAAASAAQQAAAKEADAKQKAIAAEQATLDAAKTKISSAISAPPAPPHILPQINPTELPK
jgi:lysozyme family protein